MNVAARLEMALRRFVYWLSICTIGANSICKKPLSMQRSRALKEGSCGWPDTPRQGDKDSRYRADNSLPLAVSVQSASPHESQLVEEVLGGSFLDELPARLVGDRAYDSDTLDQRLKEEYDIELIAPHRGQRRVRTQDGRKLRRYNRRWRVERLFAWLHWFRRLVTRYEYHIENFLGFVHLACLVLLLKHLSEAKC